VGGDREVVVLAAESEGRFCSIMVGKAQNGLVVVVVEVAAVRGADAARLAVDCTALHCAGRNPQTPLCAISFLAAGGERVGLTPLVVLRRAHRRTVETDFFSRHFGREKNCVGAFFPAKSGRVGAERVC